MDRVEENAGAPSQPLSIMVSNPFSSVVQRRFSVMPHSSKCVYIYLSIICLLFSFTFPRGRLQSAGHFMCSANTKALLDLGYCVIIHTE
jgi:hypothetical protein